MWYHFRNLIYFSVLLRIPPVEGYDIWYINSRIMTTSLMLIDLDQKISIRDRNRMDRQSWNFWVLSLLSKIVLRILEETMWSSSVIIKQLNYCFLNKLFGAIFDRWLNILQQYDLEILVSTRWPESSGWCFVTLSFKPKHAHFGSQPRWTWSSFGCIWWIYTQYQMTVRRLLRQFASR